MAKSFFNGNKIKEHFNYYNKQYYITLIVSLLAIIIGIIVSFSDYNFLSLLNSRDQIIFEFITGEVKALSLFYKKIKNILLSLIIIFIFNINVYSSFLSYLYLSYQMFLIVVSSAQIISLFGVGGVVVVLFIIIPVNLINYIILSIYNSVLSKRAVLANKYKNGFFDSFKENYVFNYMLICLIGLILLCFIYCYIIPLFVKNLAFIVY